jgi:enoyl-CoA hydratase/carnithine racemase
VSGVLLVEHRDAHAVLTLNRPEKRNALSVELRDAISDALDALAGDDAIKCIVVTGNGPVFCAGFDLSEFTRAAGDTEFNRVLWASSDRYHDTVLRCPLPTIAAINGAALAGGFDLAVMCDLRIASTTARFAHPERTFGDVVYGPLHDLVGGAVARDIAIGGRELDAADALTLHLVNEVVEPDQLAEATDATVARVCAAPRDVLLRTKAKALRRAGFPPGAPAATLDL